MGKRSRKEDANANANALDASNGSNHTNKPILVNDEAVDPTLALLFASSVCMIFLQDLVIDLLV
jgi:hypothetical protein